MTTQERIALIAEACQTAGVIRLLGNISTDNLTEWISAELGRANALDAFGPHGSLYARAYAPEHLLHIVSGNTPHAALQSLLRGLILGSHNTVKLPSNGLAELEQWVCSLPAGLKSMVECHHELTDTLSLRADAVIAIGSDETMAGVHDRLQPRQTFIPHGHKVSIGIVTGDHATAARLAAKDASLFNQRGCLSPHAIYVQDDARQFAGMLAMEMEKFACKHPPAPLSLSEAGAVRNLRETTRFAAANDNSTQLWHSPDNLDWTVVFEKLPVLRLSCLNRCVYVKELPEKITLSALGSEAAHLSTIAIHPFSMSFAETLTTLPAHRICALGKSQNPDLLWHHDGFAPLASLVKWKDIG